jgi:hypothetical protein
MVAWLTYRSVVGWLMIAAMALGWLLASAHSKKS